MTSDARVIYHLIPRLKAGGIESMALRFLKDDSRTVPYKIVVYEKSDSQCLNELGVNASSVVDLSTSIVCGGYFRVIKYLLKRSDQIVISSTWKSAMIMWLISRFKHFGLHVSFTHRSTHAHFLDDFFRRWQVRNSCLQLVDSDASAEWVLSHIDASSNVRVVPPIFATKTSTSGFPAVCLPLRVCFMGRLNAVKNIPGVCMLVDILAEKIDSVVFDVFGPDEGSKVDFDDWVSRLNRKNIQATYRGVLPESEVALKLKSYHFSISCSLTEGFGMSVAESLQLGVPPIVGRVGGPASYCNQDNSILLNDYSTSELRRCADRVALIFKNIDMYDAMRSKAMQTFDSKRSYVKRFEQALNSLI